MTTVERASRLIVVSSIALAAAAHIWLARWQPGLGLAAAIAFVVTFAIARAWFHATLAIVLGAAYIAPALLWLAFGALDYHLLLVWLAAVAGPVMAQFDWRRWHLPPRWLLPLVAWALIIAVSWPIVAAREVDFSVIAARAVTPSNSAFGAPPSVAAAFIVIFALAQMLGILWIDLLWARFSAAGLAAFDRFVIAPLMAGAALSALAGLYQAFGDFNWMNTFYWANERRAGGLAMDPNTLGIGAALWAPLAVVVAWRGIVPVWFAGLASAVLAAGMWVSGSRTALMAFSAGAAGVAIAALSRRGLWQPLFGRVAALGLAALLVLAMAVVPRDSPSTSPLQRIFNRIPRLEAGEIVRFADELWVRFGYGKAATDIIRDHPLTGIGIGAFHVVAPDYIYRERGRLFPGDNAQNWWRHQIAELGIIGALPSLWFSILVLGLLRGRLGDPPDLTAMRGAIAGIGLASLLGVPTQHPASWISFVSVVFWLAAQTPMVAANDAARPSKAAWIGAMSLAAITATGLAISTGDLRVVRRALDSGLPYEYGLSAPEGLSEYGEARQVAREAVWTVPVRHRWLQFTLWPPHADVASNPVVARIDLDGREAIRHTFTNREPVTYALELPDAKFVRLEANVSRATQSGWALQLASTWLREPPPALPPERIIRQRPE